VQKGERSSVTKDVLDSKPGKIERFGFRRDYELWLPKYGNESQDARTKWRSCGPVETDVCFAKLVYNLLFFSSNKERRRRGGAGNDRFNRSLKILFRSIQYRYAIYPLFPGAPLGGSHHVPRFVLVLFFITNLFNSVLSIFTIFILYIHS